MILNGKRKENFQMYKIIGENKYELHYTTTTNFLSVNIPLKYGSKLATSIGNWTIDKKKVRRTISLRQLTLKINFSIKTRHF